MVVIGYALKNAAARTGATAEEVLRAETWPQAAQVAAEILNWFSGKPFPQGTSKGLVVAAGLLDSLARDDPRSSQLWSGARTRLSHLIASRTATIEQQDAPEKAVN
jgi:hypothetical protein